MIDCETNQYNSNVYLSGFHFQNVCFPMCSKAQIHFTYTFCGYVGAINVRIAIIIYGQMLNALGFALALLQ